MPVRVLLLASTFVLATVVAGAVSAQSSVAAASAAMPQAQDAQFAPAANAAVQAVDSFMADLASGDLEAARQLMTPDAVVLSNGQVLGDRDSYLAGPAKDDTAALRAVSQRELLHRDAKTAAELGWVVSEKRLRGTVPGAQAPGDIVVTETMLLVRTAGGWKITHIHWSSRQTG